MAVCVLTLFLTKRETSSVYMRSLAKLRQFDSKQQILRKRLNHSPRSNWEGRISSKARKIQNEKITERNSIHSRRTRIMHKIHTISLIFAFIMGGLLICLITPLSSIGKPNLSDLLHYI